MPFGSSVGAPVLVLVCAAASVARLAPVIAAMPTRLVVLRNVLRS
jgi:hypothetical protein